MNVLHVEWVMCRLCIMLRRTPMPGITHSLPLTMLPRQRAVDDSEQEEMGPNLPFEHSMMLRLRQKAKAPPRM